MSISRKHYQAISGAIKQVRQSSYDLDDGSESQIIDRTLDAVVDKLVVEFEIDNPRFERERFRNATY